jgi:hypothetical protein
MKKMPLEVQQEILDILESNEKTTLIKASKIKQARLVIALKNKYDFKKKSLGMN